MARARSPDSIEAEKMYRSGMKLVEIADKLGVPDGTVRRWKSTQKWDAKKSERSEKKKANVRKPGAPVGNQNAKGAGAPEGNKNAEKHGAYSAVYWDSLGEDELEMIGDVPASEEELLLEQIRLFSIRERRLMKAIKKYTEAQGGQYVSGITSFEDKRKFKTAEDEQLYNEKIKAKVESGDRLPGQQQNIQTHTGATIDLISRLERELTSIQSKKTKAIDSLSRLRLERQKLEGETKGNEVVRSWAEKVLKTRREQRGME